jgi:hypothetical protein
MSITTVLVTLLVLSEVTAPPAIQSKGSPPQIEIDTTPQSGDSPRVQLLNEVKEVWSKLKQTEYTHRKQSVIDLDQGIVKFDCSGYVSEVLLKNALPNHYAGVTSFLKDHRTSIPSAKNGRMWMTRPLAGLFYDYFEKERPNDWLVFRSAADLKPGDLIVARYDDQWRVKRNESTTGHIMVAWEMESQTSDSIVQVRVFDSAKSGHTKELDTRHQSTDGVTALDHSGIGSGVMLFRLAGDGTTDGYKWSLSSKRWYNLVGSPRATGNQHYDRLTGILFARPIDLLIPSVNSSNKDE